MGRSLSLSLPRRIVNDMLHFARQVPTVPVQRRMNLATVRDARAVLAHRPSWTSIFTRAFARVQQVTPSLRRTYHEFPWPMLYEGDRLVANITIEREYDGEPAVFFSHIADPETLTFEQIDAALHRARTVPFGEDFQHWRALWFARAPRMIRRAVWWYFLNVLKRRRPIYLGTFGVSVYSALGAESLHPLSPLTTSLNYGVFDAEGGVDVRIVYDHRVLDGAVVARALAALETVLKTEIVAELQSQGTAELSTDEVRRPQIWPRPA